MVGWLHDSPTMSEPKRCVSVLESLAEPSRHYVGICANAETRLALHNGGRARHTSKYRPWRLLVAIQFAEESLTVRFEKYLKSGSGRAFAKRHFARHFAGDGGEQAVAQA